MASKPISKIIPRVYWISTLVLAFFNIIGIFFIKEQVVLRGIQHLGLPYWFHIELRIANLIGTIIILIPFFGKQIKEWAYVGLGIVFLSAIIAHFSIDGINTITFMPLVPFVILLTSYITYHKLNEQKEINLIKMGN